MATKKEQKEKSLEDKLWDTAELLRGKVSPTSYKDIALGLLFLKFISNKYDERRKEIEDETKNSTEKERNYLLNLKDQYTAKGVFYLKEGDSWNDLSKMASSEKNLAIKIDQMIRDANTEIQKHIIQIAISATVDILEKKLNNQEKQNLINQSVNELESVLKN